MSKLLAALRQIEAKSAVQPSQPPRRPERSTGATLQQAVNAAWRGEKSCGREVASVAKQAVRVVELPRSDDDPIAPNQPLDPLARIAVLNELLEEALATQKTPLPNKLAVKTAFQKSLHLPRASAPLANEPVANEPARLDPQVLEASAGKPHAPISVAGEFAALARRLLNDVETPAVITFATAGCKGDESFLLLPLAVALAEFHAGRLLIVEAAGNQPRWATHLGIDAPAGLTESLSAERQLKECVRATAIPRIDLLSCGKGDLLFDGNIGRRLKTLISELKRDYSLTLVAGGDSESALTKSFSLASEATVMTIGLKRTARSAAIQATEKLKAAGVRLLGSIVCQ